MVEALSPAAAAVCPWKPDAGRLCLFRQETGAAVNPFEPDTPPVTVGPAGAGEVETLYVLDDWRERGIGRALMQAAARMLRDRGCRSLFLWVLAENPSRWFYERLGGRPALRSTTPVGGVSVPRVAIVWDPIERLAGPASD